MTALNKPHHRKEQWGVSLKPLTPTHYKTRPLKWTHYPAVASVLKGRVSHEKHVRTRCCTPSDTIYRELSSWGSKTRFQWRGQWYEERRECVEKLPSIQYCSRWSKTSISETVFPYDLSQPTPDRNRASTTHNQILRSW